MNILGIMTGTSLDGIDYALVNFQEVSSKPTFSLIATHFFEYTEALKNKIRGIISESLPISEFSQFNFYLSYLFNEKYQEFLDLYSINPIDIDCIATHGQTIWHNPNNTSFLDKQIPSTLQAGNISILAKLTGKPVVGDFRSGDIALGGQGAPLVTIFDYDYFHNNNEDRILLNIGGISNITYLPKNSNLSQILAFDCGPGNILIDAIASEYFSVAFDKNGAIAKNGNINHQLLDILLNDDFISKLPPKSTGREKYNKYSIEKVLSLIPYQIGKEDILRTFTEFTATAIAKNIIQFANPHSTIIASGGGRSNMFLMELLHNKLPQAKFNNIEDYGIPSDFKEAIAFAYLGHLRLNNMPGNVPFATGASHSTILGAIALP